MMYLRHVLTEHTDGDDGVSVDWFELPPGHRSTRRRPESDQVYVVLEGELVVHTDARSIDLSTSDSVRIEGGERHSTENPGERPCVGLRLAPTTGASLDEDR